MPPEVFALFEMKKKGDKEAEIQIYEVIGKDYWGDGRAIEAKKFKDDLKALGDVDTLHVRINSPGGNMMEGNAIYNALVEHPAKKIVTIDGLAASMASLIAMAGDTIRMPKNTLMMIHNPLGSCYQTNAKEMRKMADTLDKWAEGAVAVYADRTKQSKEKIAELLDADTWMTAEDAKKLGFCDEVTDAVEISASLDPGLFEKYKNLPGAVLNFIKPKASAEPTPASEPAPAPKNEATVPEPENQGEPQTMDLKTLKEKHADLVAQIKKEELERIQAVEAQAMPGHEELIAKLKLDPECTGEKAALAVLQAEKNVRTAALATAKAEAAPAVPQPNTSAVETTTPKSNLEGLSVEDRAKKEWEADPKLQKEMDVEAYVVLMAAEAEKRTR
jgi:ATP-dependent Clp protease protease subunit